MRIPLFLIFFIISGCSMIDEYLNMNEVTITGTVPSEKFIRANDIDAIAVDFSGDMEKSKTENAFSLCRNSSSVSGRFSWKKRSLIFVPDGGFTPVSNYEISVSGNAEDRYGNSLSENFIFAFTTSGETDEPRIISTTPAENEIIDSSSPVITVAFSEKIKEESFYSAFSITPDVKGFISFSSTGEEAYFTPVEDLQPGRYYKVEISDSLKDLSGNNLKNNFSFSFKTEESIPFSVKWFGNTEGSEYYSTADIPVNNGVSCRESFLVSFEGSVPDSIKLNPVTVEPYSPYSFSWNNNFSECKITFSGILEFENIYEIIINKKRYRLMTDDPSSRPPVLSGITFCGDRMNPVFVKLALNSSISFLSSDNAFFDLYFHLAEGAVLNDYTIFNSVDFLTVNGDLSVVQKRIINPAMESLPPPLPGTPALPGTSEYIVRIECTVRAGIDPSVFRIIVDSALEDSSGSTLGEDEVIQVNSL